MTTTVSGITVKRDQIFGSPGLDRILCNYGFNRIMSSRSNDRLIYNTGLDRDRIHIRSVRGRITDSLTLVVLRRVVVVLRTVLIGIVLRTGITSFLSVIVLRTTLVVVTLRMFLSMIASRTIMVVFA